MKKVWIILALLLALSVIPVMAADTRQAPLALQAMSNLSSVKPMTDQQLSLVEGDGFFFILKLDHASIWRSIFHVHCGGFTALHCTHTEEVSHHQNEVSHRQNDRPHHQEDVSRHQGKGPHPKVEVSVSCTPKDCSRRSIVRVDVPGEIHIEQITQGGGNTSSISIVQQGNGGRNTATVKQINRAAPR